MSLVTTCALALPATFAAGAGCVFPVPLELDEADAGPSSPPVIESAAPAEFAFPGLITLDRADQRQLTLTLRDQDVDDTLYVRLFVDYGLPTATNFLSNCTAAPSGEQTRVVTCTTATLCNTIDQQDTDTHFLEAMVADRLFLEESDPAAEGQPAFRALPENASSSFRAWSMRCNPPQ